MSRYQNILLSGLLIAAWTLACLAYQPGLSGPFLFDDFPNLKEIGALGAINNWELFRAYLHSGFAGPTGRPISLASFLLDANDWPADPEPFKYTNLLVHLLIGVILFPTIRKLLHAIGRRSGEADWIALIASALWLLNPFLVSTTLYVVQRMAQLAALFSVLGIWGYLQGRLWLPTRPRLGYVTITLSVGLGTLLAVFSKENGALLPLLVLMIELALRYHWKTPGPDWRWKAVFLGLPALAILTYLAMHLPGLARPIPTRDFSLLERLLSEPRIIWSYLFNLSIPHIQTRGLYQDGFVISKGLTTPWTTLPALLALAGLGVAGWVARRRWPLVSLAILFYLAGQLLESTTIPLELYFEHRNYLPAVFLFVPVAAGILALRKQLKPALAAFVCLAIVGSYAAATWQRAGIWGGANELALVWAKTNPTSPRAQNGAAQTWMRLGHPERAIAVLQRAILKNPDSALLLANYLAHKASIGSLTASELQDSLQRLRHQPFDAQMLQALKTLVDVLNAKAPLPEHTALLMSYLEWMRSDLKGKVPVADRYSYYLQGLLLCGQGDAESALPYLARALKKYRSVETGLNIVSMLATHHHYRQALTILNQSEKVLEAEPDGKLIRPRSTYAQEITRLRANLNDDMAKQSRQTDTLGKSDSRTAKSPANGAARLPGSS